MCPSFRATGEEMHSTRGRARLLFEMANGQVIGDGWRSAEVAEALDLCLSCKGCKRDCPVGVDMAAYKTEFLAQRYRGRLRPAAHYSMGALPRWLHVVGRLPARVVDALNAAARGPLGAVAKRLGGIAPERAIPPIARRPFTRGGAPPCVEGHRSGHLARMNVAFRTRRRPARRAPPRSEAARACCSGRTPSPTTSTPASPPTPSRCSRPSATPSSCRRAPSAAGSPGPPPARSAPPAACCGAACGRSRPWLAAGVPVVGLEPSCTAALRADGPELLPDEPLAARLAQGVRTFAEVLADHGDALRAAVVAPGQRALVQVHCHQHAELGTEADHAAMAALGIEAEVLDSGCCGLAGNFGFEQGHYAVSMACAERVLLPAVRAADADVAVLADGFSCRTQLRQAGTREPVHLAQLAARALGVRQAN